MDSMAHNPEAETRKEVPLSVLLLSRELPDGSVVKHIVTSDGLIITDHDTSRGGQQEFFRSPRVTKVPVETDLQKFYD